MRILEKVLLYMKKMQFKPENFVFKGILPKESDILILLPKESWIFSLCFNAIDSLHKYFDGEIHFYGPQKFSNFIEIFFEDAIYWSEKDAVLNIGTESIDILWDLCPPPSVRIDIPLHIKATYRVTSDRNAFPFFNIIVPIEKKDYLSFFSSQLMSLNITLTKFLPKLNPRARSIAWDYLLYKGHREENVLIFWDLNFRDERILNNIGKFFDYKVTYITPNDNLVGFINLDMKDLDLVLASLSLSHLYVGGESLFLGPSFFLKIPILLVSKIIKLPNHGKWFRDVEDVETFYEKLKEILGQ